MVNRFIVALTLLVAVTFANVSKKRNQEEQPLDEMLKRIPDTNMNGKGNRKTASKVESKGRQIIEMEKEVYGISDFGNGNRARRYARVIRDTTKSLPSKIDWRNKSPKKLVTDRVYNQRQWGCCYAIGTVASIVGQWAKKKNILEDLSVQQICDCAFKAGCPSKGGAPAKVFEYVEQEGLYTEADYKFVGGRHACKLPAKKPAVYINSSRQVNSNEDSLAHAVANIGPISVRLTVGTKFQAYKKGVLDGVPQGSTGFHRVLLVGYTQDYWIIKNSYGTGWGEQGYARLRRGNNPYGIAEYALYPIVDDATSDCARIWAHHSLVLFSVAFLMTFGSLFRQADRHF